MPPRPNDRGRTAESQTAAKQSSQSYDISSQGEEEDDFIGDDSFDGSPQGSWDSSARGGDGRQTDARMDGGLSSGGESLDDDDGFIRQDLSSGEYEGAQGAGEYEGAQGAGAAARGSPPDRADRAGRGQAGGSERPESYSGDDDEAAGGSRDSEGHDDGPYRPPASDAEEHPPRSESVPDAPASQASGVRSLTSGSAVERYEDHFEEDDAEGADSGGARPQQERVRKETEPVEYSFEEESDGDAAASDGGAADPARPRLHAAAEHAPGGPAGEVGVSGKTPARGVSTANAQAYMQSRLSMHLLAVDSEDDDDATPRLPSLSARESERRREQELLMRTAQEARDASNFSASDEDAATPRLEERCVIQEQAEAEQQPENEDESTPRIISVSVADAKRQSCEASADDAKAEAASDASAGVEGQVNASIQETTAPNELHSGDGDGARGSLEESLEGMLEQVAMRVVLQAISDAGGRVVSALLAEPQSCQSVTAESDQQVHSAQEVNGGTVSPDLLAENVLEAASLRDAYCNTSDAEANVPEQPNRSLPEAHGADKTIDLEVMGSSEYYSGQRETTTEQDEEDVDTLVTGVGPPQEHNVLGIQDLHPTTNLDSNVDENLQTVLVPDVYLDADKHERPDEGRKFANYSVRLESEEQRPTRPSSRVNSRPSTTSSSIVSNQPRAEVSKSAHKTRIQMRSAQGEVSYETSQGSHGGLRQRSSGTDIVSTSQEFLGRPDWNFDTAKFSRNQKEKNRYESPVQVPGSKWVRTGKPLQSQSSTSFADSPHKQNSVETMSFEDKGIQSEDSKVSVTARAKEYWANNALIQDHHKRTRARRRPGTSQSKSGSYDLGEDGIMSKRPETTDGYASRFRYNVRGTRGGTFGHGARKDDVDWKIRDAATKPGAGEYEVTRQNSTPMTGGKMLESFDAVGSASWEFKKRKGMPGPGQYDRDLNEPRRVSGGRFGGGNRWKETQVFEQRSSELPGPLDYDAGDSRDRANKRVVGGVISDAEVKRPSTYKLPPMSTTKIRATGGKVGREPRLKPIYATSDSSPGPGSYFKESASEVENEISMRRTASRNSVATSRSRASIGRDRSQDMPPYTGCRRTFLDDLQTRSAKTPGPAHYEVDSHTVQRMVSRQALDRDWSISAPGSSDPVVYSIGQSERSSIVSDYRTIKSLQRSWADSANHFKTLLESFVSSRVQRETSELSQSAALKDMSVLSPIHADDGAEDAVFLTQQH